MLWFAAAAASALAAGAVCWKNIQNERLMFCGGEDSDMKIAPEFPSRRREADAGEAAAQEFADQKEKGNVEKAYLLGTQLAGFLLSGPERILNGSDMAEDPDVVLNARVLFAFTVDASLEASPASELITQTAANFFYESVKAAVPELYSRIVLPEAFSLYLLCLRDGEESGQNIGEPFAKLCGREEDPELTALGNRLYAYFQKVCRSKIEEVRFQ
jgi:hypothetical protein